MKQISNMTCFSFLFLASFIIGFSSGGSICIESERQALLSFKKDLTDPCNRLASWSADDGDCCQWNGVVCDNFTGHVLQLHLSNPHPEYYISYDPLDYDSYIGSKFGGRISLSLVDLIKLTHLDLSFNDFGGIQIPEFIGFMKNLKYLNFSTANFSGIIPHQLGNLFHLQYLDLNSHYYYSGGLYVENLEWVSNLTLLKHLDLSHVNLNKTSHRWLSTMSSLPRLEILRLSSCSLQLPPHQSFVNFSSLTTLDLSDNYFCESIPSWISYLYGLTFLDLSGNDLYGSNTGVFKNLTSVRHLDLSENLFNYSLHDLLYAIPHPDYLEYLSLSYAQLHGSIPSSLGNLTSMTTLYLPDNNLQGSIPVSLGNMTSLTALDLSYNYQLEGRIPASFGRLCNLRSVDMSHLNLHSNISHVLDISSDCDSVRLETMNFGSIQLRGHLTDSIGRYKNLHTLDLSNNLIDGPIPPSFWELSSLEYLDLSNNKLNATISHFHLTNLTKLIILKLGGNTNIAVKVESDWVAPFQLKWLDLRSCNLGPRFPSWIRSQRSLSELYISDNRITDVIPHWFWKSLSQFSVLDISHNQIHQMIPNFTDGIKIYKLYLSSNNFFGPLPQLYPSYVLDLSNNAFSGSISKVFCHIMNNTEVLNLENNSFTGELPNCVSGNWGELLDLNLGNNRFSGKLPSFLGNCTHLNSLILRKNNFSGTFPVGFFKNCTHLNILDISENQFGGNILFQISQAFSDMRILNLRGNKFWGSLPTEICRLSNLHILDLSDNHLSGIIPYCIDNLSAMVTNGHYLETNGIYFMDYDKTVHMFLVNKETLYDYSSNLNLVRLIDLSRNKFSGEIPMQITSLRALQSLNLSHNLFVGRIPDKIGAMEEMERIDFSANQLSGEIPPNITNLTFLSFMNVSYNKLIGRIPSSTQIGGFDASCFVGNNLTGCPLPIDCNASAHTPAHVEDQTKKGDEHEVNLFYIGLPFGFVVGFWSFIVPLLVNRRWRYLYFAFLDRLGDNVYFMARKFK